MFAGGNIYANLIWNFSGLQENFFHSETMNCAYLCTGSRKKDESFDLKDAKVLPGSFAFTTLVPMAIAILLEITVHARRKPTMITFVFLSDFSDKRFG